MIVRSALSFLFALSFARPAAAGWFTLYWNQNDPPAMDFPEPQRGYAVGPAGKVLRTVNGGSAWTLVDVAANRNFRGLDFTDPDTGWVWGDTVLYRTSDGGATWERKTTGGENFYSFHFLNGTFGFAKYWIGALYATVDGGRTWRPRHPDGAEKTFYSYAFLTPAIGYAVIADTAAASVQLKKTVDSGATWSAQAFPTGLTPVSVQFDGAQRGWVAAKDAQGKLSILSTVDGGGVWTRKDTQAQGRFYQAVFSESGAAYFFDHQGVEGPILRVSRDNGDTWASSPYRFASNNPKACLAGPATAFVSDLGFIASTTDGGAAWTKVYDGISAAMPFTSVRFVDALSGWIADEKGSVLKSTDGGRIWSRQIAGQANWSGLAASDPRHAVAGGALPDSAAPSRDFVGLLASTRDGGATWTESRLPKGRSVVAVSHPTSRKAYAACHKAGGIDSAYFLSSLDSGATWQPAGSMAGKRPMKVHFLDEDVGYLAARDSTGSVHKSVDGGLTWQPLARIPGSIPIDMFWHSRDIGWFLTFQRVYRTLDGGATWQRSDDSLGIPNMRAIRFSDDKNGWIVTSSMGMRSTHDGGRTWKAEPVGGMNDAWFLPNGEGWGVGANGTVHKYQPDPTWIGPSFRSPGARPAGRDNPGMGVFRLDAPGKPRLWIDALGRLRLQPDL